LAEKEVIGDAQELVELVAFDFVGEEEDAAVFGGLEDQGHFGPDFVAEGC